MLHNAPDRLSNFFTAKKSCWRRTPSSPLLETQSLVS